MDYTFAEDLQRLRRDLRARIAERFPDGFPTIFNEDSEPLAASLQFVREFGADGYMTMAWPAQYGGQDASLWAQIVVAEEMWAHNEPRGGTYYGPNWVGPTIMHYGTPAQKAEHLPRIARGEGLWAQGYSEPEAGSDLAGLRLKAERSDGGWRLNGQKIWTSFADYAEWIILASRSSTNGPKHQGITVFLLPMDRTGIEVRPIHELTGGHDFNEVFFEDVFASDEEVLGEVGRGWEVLTASLRFERVGNPRWARTERLLAEARRVLSEDGAELSGAAAQAWVRAATSARVARLLHYRAIAEREQAADSSVSSLASSVARIATSLTDQEATSAVLDVLGPVALRGHGETGVPMGGEAQHEWRLGLTATVAAGTLEVQQLTVAREVLGPTSRR